MKYCAQCGAQLVDEAVVCPKCGCAVAPTKTVDSNASPKSRLITLLLCIFVGGLGSTASTSARLARACSGCSRPGASASARWST